MWKVMPADAVTTEMAKRGCLALDVAMRRATDILKAGEAMGIQMDVPEAMWDVVAAVWVAMAAVSPSVDDAETQA